jgi:serine/threonine-protein kinase
LGNWAAVDSAYQRAVQLDPRDADLPGDLGGNTYVNLRRYADAVRAYNQALALAPDLGYAAVAKGMTYVAWKGDLDTLRSALSNIPKDADLGGGATVAGTRALLLLYERKADSLLVLVRDCRGGASEFDELFQPALYSAWAHRLRGEEQAASAAFASALRILATASDDGQDGWRVHALRGAALAGLGRRAEALREVRWLQESSVCRDDQFASGPLAQDARAFILAQLGEADAAVDEIERGLRSPVGVSTVHTLRLDPRWDPIRNHPRFKALLVKYANPERSAPVREK